MAKKKVEPKMQFADKDEAIIAQQQFRELKNHPAWVRLVKYYEKKIEFFDDELKDGDITSLDQLERLRDKIRLCIQFKNLPDILSTMIDLTKGKEVDFDPFYTPEQIIAEKKAKKG